MERLFLDIQKFASGTINFPNNGSMYGKIEWSSVVQGSTPEEKASLNKSSVTAILYVKRNDGYTTWGNFSGALAINAVSSSTVYPYLSVDNNWYEVTRYTREVPHNNDGSKSTVISGWITGPTETSWQGKTVNGAATVVLDKIPRYATSVQSLKSKTETSITMNWSSDSTIDYIWYSKDNGTNWTAVGSVNATSGSYTISSLTANTTYQIKTRVRRKDSQLTTDSDNLPVSTHPYPYAETLPAFTIGGNPTIGIKNPLNRTFSITVYGADNSVIYTGSNKTGTSIIDILNGQTEINKLYQSIPNATSGKYKVKIDTSLPSSTTIQSTNLYSVDEDECRPTFSDFTYADINATTTALTGNSSIIIQNYSNVRATISTANKAVAKHSATMVKYDLIIPGNTTNSENYSDNSDVVITTNGAKSGTIKVSAEDSRKIPKVVEKTATFKAYTTIQKNEIKAERANNVGTGVTLTYDGTLWGQSFGSVTNTAKSARYRYKKTNEDWPQTWNGTTTITPTTSGNNYSFTGGIAGDLGNTGFSAEYSFNIEVEVFDELSSTVFSFVLGTGIPHIAVADDGIAIKQPYNTTTGGALQVNGNTNVTGKISASGNIEASGKLKGNSFTRNTTDTWVPVLNQGYLDYTLRKIFSSKTHTNHGTDNDGLATMSVLSWWNGAYNSSNSSNLTYAHQGTIQCKPTSLYDNSSGTTGTVNLSQSCANFSFLEIFYMNNNSSECFSCNIYSPNGKNTHLHLIEASAAASTYIRRTKYTISGTTITPDTNSAGYLALSTTVTHSNNKTNYIKIYKVVGWK